MGNLPHYILPKCDLLETVGSDERNLARQAIKEILLDPLKALLTSPRNPQQIYGDVCPEHLVVAFHGLSAHPTCEQNRKYLSELLTRVDERRQERFRKQRESDNQAKVFGRTELTGLVATLKQIKHV